jgi:cysteinyl-tRNA synthetase
MAKSAGNVITIQTVIDRGYDPLAFRYLCFNGRYRRQVDFTDDALESAATTLRRLRERVAMLGPVAASTESEAAKGYAERFTAVIDEDLDMPGAVKVLHEALSDEAVPPSERAALVSRWDDILGLDLAPSATLDEELEALITQREDARKNKDFSRADAIRDELRDRGVELLDSAEGTTWVKR